MTPLLYFFRTAAILTIAFSDRKKITTNAKRNPAAGVTGLTKVTFLGELGMLAKFPGSSTWGYLLIAPSGRQSTRLPADASHCVSSN